jgi:hypothetical protein
MAQRQVLKWIMQHDAWNEKYAPKSADPAVPCRISPDPDNADAARASRDRGAESTTRSIRDRTKAALA